MIISRSIILRFIFFSDKFVGKMKSRILCLITFFFESRAFHEIMWKYKIEPDRPQMKWRMRIAYWTIKATTPHLEYVTIIVSPQQKWLQERA
jgi:hypothetical protein